MAHESTLTGGVSESLAHAMFMSRGFGVFTAVVPEAYDMIVEQKDENGDIQRFTVQVKTIKIRHDREGQLVVRGANNSGVPYSKQDVDYLMGIHLPSNTGYLIPNREIQEYWAKDFEAAAHKWTEFTLGDETYGERSGTGR